MKMVPAEKFGIIASMPFKCGHTVDMFYAAEKFALIDEPKQKNQLCIHCVINAQRAAMKARQEGDTL